MSEEAQRWKISRLCSVSGCGKTTACHPECVGLPSLGRLPSCGGDLRGWHIPRISVYSSAGKHIHAVPSAYPTPLFVLLGICPLMPVSHSLPLPLPAFSFSHSQRLSPLSLLSSSPFS